MFTANKLLEVCKTQNGTVGGEKYWKYFGYNSSFYNKDWCCVFGCWALAEAGKNIGCWPNCGRVKSDGGIQYGMEAAGFKKVNSLDEAGAGACIIINHHNDSYYIYDHFVIWKGTYSNDGKSIKVWNGNASNSVKESEYPINHIEAIFMPNFENVKNGWYLEGGKYRHYTDGVLDKNKWAIGNGQYSDNWYYLGDNGYVVKNTWILSGDSWYYLKNDGVMATNEIVYWKGKYYYLTKNGKMQEGGSVTLNCAKDGVLSLP